MIKIEKRIKGFSVKDNAAPSNPMPLPPVSELDRRIIIKPVEGLVERSLRSPKRPDSHTVPDKHGKLHQGHAAWNSDVIRAPSGKFALSISAFLNGCAHPFEIWALGREAPSSTSELCQILSRVLSVDDPEFLKYHLRALKGAVEEPFEFQLPFTGDWVRAGSVGAAIAMVLEQYALAVGFIDDQPIDPSKSPMLQAMTSLSEPKTMHGFCGLAPYFDVRNTSTGEEFVCFVKEAVTAPSGALFPFSVWFAGRRAPAESEPLCKMLSLGLRHSEVEWTLLILDPLLNHSPNPRDDQSFWAPVPGTAKKMLYRSSWHYVATILRHRLIQVGRLTPEGKPVGQGSLFALPEATVHVGRSGPSEPVGTECPACGAHKVVRLDSCATCLECSWSKC